MRANVKCVIKKLLLYKPHIPSFAAFSLSHILKILLTFISKSCIYKLNSKKIKTGYDIKWKSWGLIIFYKSIA